jgi:signal transduction histidine kinase
MTHRTRTALGRTNSNAQRAALRVLEGAFDGVLIVDRIGRVCAANPPAGRMFGRSVRAMLGKRVKDIGAASSAGAAPKPAAPEDPALKQTLLTIERPDLSTVEVIVRKFPGYAPRTQLWILRMATPEHAAAEARERNSRLLIDAERVGGVGGWALDVKKGLIAWTPEMRRIMEMPLDAETIAIEDSYNFYTPTSRSIVREAFNATLARGIPYDLVLECVTGKGNRIWVREVCRASMRRGRLVSVIGFSQDITEQRRLAGLLNDIGNQERARIGADLHDGLGQELTGLALLLRGVAMRAERSGSALASELCGLSVMASKSIETVREIAHGLLPLKLSHASFRQILRRLARSSHLTLGVRVSIRFHGENGHMPVGEIAENLYRIAQEAIANAVKHGHAKHVTLRLRASETKVIFTASDDGSGIDLDSHSEGMGLQIMRYRTRMLGGLVDMRRMRRGGTRLRCVMPRNSLSS